MSYFYSLIFKKGQTSEVKLSFVQAFKLKLTIKKCLFCKKKKHFYHKKGKRKKQKKRKRKGNENKTKPRHIYIFFFLILELINGHKKRNCYQSVVIVKTKHENDALNIVLELLFLSVCFSALPVFMSQVFHLLNIINATKERFVPVKNKKTVPRNVSVRLC